MILVDILLALGLGGVFAAILGGSSNGARELFIRAHERDMMLRSYEKGIYSSSTIPYGNDRRETLISVSTSSSSRPMNFHSVASARARVSDAAGTPLCSVDFFGDADRAPLAKPIVLPVDPLLPLTDIEVRNGVAYISADSAAAADPDLFIVDIHNTAEAHLLASLNTGPGIVAIALAGKRIYAAASSMAGQLQIVRLDALGAPVLEKKYRLPLPFASATPAVGSAIFFDKNIVYLGTEKWDGNEFNAVAVSNPTSPAYLGGSEIASKVNDIIVQDGQAYVSDAGQNQLLRLDLADASHPLVTGALNPTGWQRQEGRVISFFEGGLGFGRTSGGYNVAADHEIFSWPLSMASLQNSVSADIPGGVYGIVLDRRRIFLATRQPNKELQIFDRNLAFSSARYFPLAVAPQALTCDGDKLYLLAHNAPFIYEITFH